MNRIANRLITYLGNPFIISILIFAVILIFLPSINKYEIEHISHMSVAPGIKVCYDDLNYDGNSEKINIYDDFTGKISVIVWNSNEHIINQWNFEGKHVKCFKPIITDYDSNGFKEINILSLQSDSVFLNYIEPQGKSYNIKRKLFLFKTKSNAKEFYNKSFQTIDSDNDGYKELILNFTAGFALYPRNLVLYNFKQNKVTISPEFGIASNHFTTLEIDGQTMITLSSAATGNHKTQIEYSDRFSWLVLFNSELKHKFDPIKTGPIGGISYAKFIINNGIPYIVVLSKLNTSEDQKLDLLLYSTDGILLKSLDLLSLGFHYYTSIFSSNNSNEVLYINDEEGTIYSCNTSLELKKFDNIKLLYGVGNVGVEHLDIDNNGLYETLFITSNLHSVIITQDKFKDPILIDNKYGANHLLLYSVRYQEGKPPQIAIQNGQHINLYSYEKSNVYRYKLIIYLGLYIGIFLFIYLIVELQRKRLNIKYQKQRQLSNLQIQAIKNQIDPHFTLNVLNSIGSLFLTEEAEKADYLFSKYAKLLFNTVMYSDKSMTSLKVELENIENYLNIEAFRLNNGFNYTINTDSKIDLDIEFPRMLFMTFVENAIKHGVRTMKADGYININLLKVKTTLIIEIENNGKYLNQDSLNTNRGLNIIDQIIATNNQINKQKISYNTLRNNLDNKLFNYKVNITISL